MNNLITLEEALSLNRKQTRELYRSYVNPGLAGLLSMLNFDKHFIKAKGALVWDAEGNEYIDFLSGYGALSLGHNHPAITDALDRVKETPSLLQVSLSKLSAVLAHNLASITPGDLRNCFFCNSGDEAVEGALKLARAATGRKRFIYCKGSFHGKTLGALSVSGKDKYRKPFRPLLPDCHEIPFGEPGALEKAIKNKKAAAFILEPIQSEGGIIIPQRGYLKEVQELCNRYGTLLIMDESQTGFGRCGEMFACDLEKVTPDVMCLSNFLGGGIMPAGAFITTEKHWNKAFGGIDSCFLHTSTYGGNTRAMAAGIAAVNETVNQDLPRLAREKGAYMTEKLRNLAENNKLIKDIRGTGLLLGIEFNPITRGSLNAISVGLINKLGQEFLASIVASELVQRHGIITAYTLNNPNVLRLEPPLNITEKQIDRMINSLRETLDKTLRGILVNSGKTIVSSILKRHENLFPKI